MSAEQLGRRGNNLSFNNCHQNTATVGMATLQEIVNQI